MSMENTLNLVKTLLLAPCIVTCMKNNGPEVLARQDAAPLQTGQIIDNLYIGLNVDKKFPSESEVPKVLTVARELVEIEPELLITSPRQLEEMSNNLKSMKSKIQKLQSSQQAPKHEELEQLEKQVINADISSQVFTFWPTKSQ